LLFLEIKEMSNEIRFRVCRGCLASSDVAELVDLFVETEEYVKKIQEISKIDVSF
jgi:hypothetical protein